MPEPGQAITCEDKEPLQYAFYDDFKDISDIDWSDSVYYQLTKIEDISNGTRFIYHKQGNRIANAMVIPEVLISMINADLVDTENNETLPMGPVALSNTDDKVFWHNNISTLMVSAVNPSDDDSRLFAIKIAELVESSK